jgi:hypothetical protein
VVDVLKLFARLVAEADRYYMELVPDTFVLPLCFSCWPKSYLASAATLKP